MQSITFRKPVDLHVHFRDGAMLETVVAHTARQFARAIVMPNLVPPVTTAAAAEAYRGRVLAAVPEGVAFTPMMTCYLTDDTDPADLIGGHASGIFAAAKLYPAHATTNSAHGVTSIEGLDPVLAAMAEAGMPLLVHGELVHDDIDIFDREARFIDGVLAPLLDRHPALKVVMEHITTRDGAQFVASRGGRVAATITPQHLLYDRNVLFVGGIRPHYYCLPILKRREHQEALRAAATGGSAQYFLGTDTAPHMQHLKEAACGCAGVFSAPVAIEAYLKVFEEENALDAFEAFAALNGPAFYGFEPSQVRVTYEKRAWTAPQTIAVGEDAVVPLFAGETVDWALKGA
ncbi:dihydroorotase [Pelagibacterium lacus]|uniref:Dihydroorotase n=1 Tax=Pelagibacterium lacus TaxID=2282655 RepID=A0A369W6Y3_9HYPH|nr:dihydroorotase [Pelagibacterium lacus]RDE10083.1 dihydroorotase [Pelagibacterium lacus]